MSWEYIRLGDVCAKIGSGATPKGGSTVYIDEGTSFIRSQNIYNLEFSHEGLAHITEDAAKKLNGVAVQKDDVLINITGDSVARTCMVPDAVLPARVNQHVAIVRPDSNRLNPRFLNYYLASPYMQSLMLGLAVGKGASRNAMTKDMLANFDILCPPIEIQESIVGILSTYDALIENNQKQIKLLEEAARRLYKEWFVNFRFPGYEDTPIVDGVPEGWEKVPVGNLISYEIGGGWGEETPTGKCIREAYVIRGTDLYGIAHGDLLSIPFRYHVESNLSLRKLKDGDIVFEVSGGSRTEGVARCLLITSSMLNVWRKDVMCASFCKLIRPQFGFSQYLHDCIKHLRATGKTEEYDKRSASSIVNYRWKDFLSQALVLRPSEEILDHYNGVAKEIYSKAINCSLQIESAKKARDRLLPKLMSGEIEV